MPKYTAHVEKPDPTMRGSKIVILGFYVGKGALWTQSLTTLDWVAKPGVQLRWMAGEPSAPPAA